jgi:hypothetical protein
MATNNDNGDGIGVVQEEEEDVEEDEEGYDDDDDDEEEDAVPSVIHTFWTACQHGDIVAITMLLAAGEDINISDTFDSPITVALIFMQLAAAQFLLANGADLSLVTPHGRNALHAASMGGDIACIDWVLSKTTIDVNSTQKDGFNSIMLALHNRQVEAAKLLMLKGANLFMKNEDDEAAIDMERGPEVLQYAKDLRFESVKPLLLLSKSCSSSVLPLASSSVISVFGNADIIRHMSDFFLRTELIVKDPSISEDDQELDDVKRRIEASLAEASNKRARTS